MSTVAIWPAKSASGYDAAPLLASDRFGIYKVEVAWSSFLKGVFVVDTSLLGSADGLGGSTYNSPFGGPYDDLTRRSDNGVRTKTISWTRGRSDDLSTVQALNANITVSDPLGMMNKKNPASPLNIGSVTNGSLRPLRPVRVSCYFAGVWWPILFGFLRSVDFEPQGRKGTATLEVTDLFTFLDKPRKDQPNSAPMPVIAYTTTAYGAPITTGGAIGLILDWLGWTDTSLRRLDAGDEIPFFEATGDKTALQLIQELLAPNLGLFYIDAAGAAVYENRSTSLARPVAATIVNKMQALGAGVSADSIRNKWSVTRQIRTAPGQYTDSTPQEAFDFVSSNEFGESTGDLKTPYLFTDAQALGLAQYLLTQTANPDNNTPLWRLSISNRETELMLAMLGLDLRDKIVASEAQTGTTGTFFIEQQSGTIDAAGHSHSVSYILSDRNALVSPLIVGTSTVGGADTMAY